MFNSKFFFSSYLSKWFFSCFESSWTLIAKVWKLAASARARVRIPAAVCSSSWSRFRPRKLWLHLTIGTDSYKKLDVSLSWKLDMLWIVSSNHKKLSWKHPFNGFVALRANQIILIFSYLENFSVFILKENKQYSWKSNVTGHFGPKHLQNPLLAILSGGTDWTHTYEIEFRIFFRKIY